MKITESRFRQLIREEIKSLINEEKTYGGQKLPLVRMVGPNGLAGVAKNGQNVILGKGFPGTPDDEYQLFVLPPGKVIGHYDDFMAAISASVTGERYYASFDETCGD